MTLLAAQSPAQQRQLPAARTHAGFSGLNGAGRGGSLKNGHEQTVLAELSGTPWRGHLSTAEMRGVPESYQYRKNFLFAPEQNEQSYERRGLTATGF